MVRLGWGRHTQGVRNGMGKYRGLWKPEVGETPDLAWAKGGFLKVVKSRLRPERQVRMRQAKKDNGKT